jgi:hypothetical protein
MSTPGHLQRVLAHQESIARARRFREMLWAARQDLDEDQRIEKLEAKCAELGVQTWEAMIP